MLCGLDKLHIEPRLGLPVFAMNEKRKDMVTLRFHKDNII